MTRRTISPERADALRAATADATLEYLRRAGGGISAQIIVAGLMTAVVEIIGRDVKPRNRADVIARCRAALDAVELRR